eukprot:IDg1751t1
MHATDLRGSTTTTCSSSYTTQSARNAHTVLTASATVHSSNRVQHISEDNLCCLIVYSSEYPAGYCAICARSLDYYVLQIRHRGILPSLLQFLQSIPVELLCQLCMLTEILRLINASSGITLSSSFKGNRTKLARERPLLFFFFSLVIFLHPRPEHQVQLCQGALLNPLFQAIEALIYLRRKRQKPETVYNPTMRTKDSISVDFHVYSIVVG